MSSKLDQDIDHKQKSHEQFSCVILWSLPRSRSTVLERSIRELKDVDVLHEPHQHIIYQKDGSAKTDPAATFEATRTEIISQAELCLKNARHLFVKEISYLVMGKHSAYIQGGFEHFKHTFLIRHPLKVAHSWQKVMQAVKRPFEPYELSIEESYNMYETVRRTIDPTPLVIDSGDLVQHPRVMMKLYCNATGLPFSEDMLTWEPREIPRWKQCPNYQEWHGEVMTSSGFKKDSPARYNTLRLEDLSPVFQEAVKHALPFYEKLHSVRTLPSSGVC